MTAQKDEIHPFLPAPHTKSNRRCSFHRLLKKPYSDGDHRDHEPPHLRKNLFPRITRFIMLGLLPDHGLGLNDDAKTQLTAVARWLRYFDIFRARPDSDFSLLSNRSEDEAYMSHIPGEAWSVFFPDGGSWLAVLTNNDGFTPVPEPEPKP